MTRRQSIGLFCAFFLITGCFKPPVLPTLDEAHKKFVELCAKEYKLDVKVIPLQKTVWIYVPVEERLVDTEIKGQRTEASPEAKEKLQIKYLKGLVENGQFAFRYDISQNKSYTPESPGYGYNATEAYTKTYLNIMTAIYRSYFEVESIPGDRDFVGAAKDYKHDQLVSSNLKTQKAPDFFVIVIADIKRGLEAEVIFYFNDYKRQSTQDIPQEEFSLRVLSQFYGDPHAVGNREGSHLAIKEITLPEFLAKQIENRIRFKYEKSDFPPQLGNDVEIATIVATTLGYYNFEDFSAVKLTDLDLNKEMLFEKDKLKSFEEP